MTTVARRAGSPSRLSLLPGDNCQNRKIDNGLAGDFFMGEADSFSQVRRQPKVKKKPRDRNHVGKDARNSQVAGRWAPNLFFTSHSPTRCTVPLQAKRPLVGRVPLSKPTQRRAKPPPLSSMSL